MLIVGLMLGFIIGFVSAYGFDTWLQWKDDNKWR
jgi:hypothetical protein